MKRRLQILAGVTLLLGSYGLARVGAGKESSLLMPPAGGAFAIARIHLEQNATDGDFEVVCEALGGDEGLTKLTVVAPDARTIIDFTAPAASPLGIREFRFESPEPKDFKSLKAAYPEGVYTFSGVTASGNKLEGKATLSHKLLEAPSLVRPKLEARGVGTKNLEIAWSQIKYAVAYTIYIEQEASKVNLTARLLGSADTFAVPEGFLLPGTKYTLGIGAVTTSGNVSFVETSFMTAAQ